MNLADLQQKINRYFDVSELKNLCLELEIDYENLSGSNKSDKSRELITYLQRRGKLEELVDRCERQRPNVLWREVGDRFPESTTTEISNEISVLFLAADPTNAARLRLGEEFREIQEKLQLAKLRDKFILHQRTSLRPADISQALLDLHPQIVHFSGHGTNEGELCFEDHSGKALRVQPNALNDLFGQFANTVNCVVLNACYSEAQAKGISNRIDYVVGMHHAVNDGAAIAFAIGFYRALGAGCAFEEAYTLGCVQIGLQGYSGPSIPVLLRCGEISQQDSDDQSEV